MNTPQQHTLEQAKALLDSADHGDPIHWELSKYLFRNMNSVEFAIKSGWLQNASDDEKEFSEKFVSLRDQYLQLFEDESGIASVPEYCTEVIPDILDYYDFSTEAGQIILNMIKTHVAQNYASGMENNPDEYAKLNQEIQDKIEKIDQNMKPQN